MKKALLISSLLCVVIVTTLFLYLSRPEAENDPVWGDIFVGYTKIWDDEISRWVPEGGADWEAVHHTEGYTCSYLSLSSGWYTLCDSRPSMAGRWLVSAAKEINGTNYGVEVWKYYDGGGDRPARSAYDISCAVSRLLWLSDPIWLLDPYIF